MKKITFENFKPNPKKLIKFGFIENNDKFILNKKILNAEFGLDIFVYKDGTISTKLTEILTNEPYTLHLAESAGGDFVGRIREEYQNIIDKIKEECFDNDVFQFDQTKRIINYVKETYKDELEFLWEKTPDAAIFRRKDSKKWYGIIMRIPKNRLKLKGYEPVEIINLKLLPEEIIKLTDNKKYFPAYHMNKKHWISIILDERIYDNEIFKTLDISYNLANK